MSKKNCIDDKRVHLLLYFFGSSHPLSNDFTIMKKFQKYVNVIPVIAKADSFKPDEMMRMKF